MKLGWGWQRDFYSENSEMGGGSWGWEAHAGWGAAGRQLSLYTILGRRIRMVGQKFSEAQLRLKRLAEVRQWVRRDSTLDVAQRLTWA
jgi:hypothetical protein